MVLADLDPELYGLRLGVPASVLGKVKNIGGPITHAGLIAFSKRSSRRTQHPAWASTRRRATLAPTEPRAGVVDVASFNAGR